ncbi:IspD/TarI family cytidylyltransferase [Couchioplanes caeruleus]|uniref:2-C-methyl-D-erythritol 4-phosphate cytidylyltransferase n=1 Tax=Couchioplanes caeruleus TaxID=56438 RepID=A0A3N1GMW2_9ACTN|nr:2-C-methyl-D-erythritol 4-phosphate cytidylyltransferase [Couchioplanes caeruleus]ROP31577.1 2-C-methyl-D-erythritol 4-phosphate cytidylyltransferase [Couchioplanes caeruleus]
MTAQLNARGDVAVLIPAAGSGLRLGPGAPKALRPLAGEPLLVHAVRRVASAPSVRMIVVAAPAAEVDAVRVLLEPIAPVVVVPGGAERQDSVAAMLAAVPAETEIVLVHDAARALTPPDLVESVAAAVRSGHPAVIPVLPVVDTIKEIGPGETVLGTVDRSVLRSVQTPQGFRHAVLAAAHGLGPLTHPGDAPPAGRADDAGPAARADDAGPAARAEGAGPTGRADAGLAARADDAGPDGGAGGGGRVSHTDDAGMVEKAGTPVVCVPGSDLAMKITRPLDLVIAEALLRVA